MIIDSKEILNKSYNFRRIISLVPSLTELLSDLGVDEKVTGITKFCVHPKKWFEGKTRVGGTKNVNIKIIRSLNPDLIIANKEENSKKQIEELSEDYNIVLTDIYNLHDAILSILHIGKLTGRDELSKKMVAQIKTKFDSLNLFLQNKTKVKAAYLIWQNPYMAAGGDTYISDMMQYCGLQNIFSDIKRYPEITLDDIKKSECEVLLLSSEPYPFKEKHVEKIKKLLPGVKIILADGEMFSWYGSRLLKAANYFKSLHQNLFIKNNN